MGRSTLVHLHVHHAANDDVDAHHGAHHAIGSINIAPRCISCRARRAPPPPTYYLHTTATSTRAPTVGFRDPAE